MLLILRLTAWCIAYAFVSPIAWATRTPRRLVICTVLAATTGVVGMRSCQSPTLRIATFNIENYGMPGKRTDERRLLALLGDLDADVIAVQEIADAARFAGLVESVSAGGRHYTFVPSRCGGRRNLHVGFLVDAAHARVLGTPIEYPELAPGRDDACAIDDRPGLLVRFAFGGHRFDLLVVHFAAGRDQVGKRRTQWERALSIVAERRAKDGVAVAIIGDVNSTGYLDDAGDERTWIHGKLESADMRLLTERLPCSEYFQPEGQRHLEVSTLDHLAATADFPIAHVASVRGYCEEVGCAPRLRDRPADFATVSDHCPVVVGAVRAP